MNTDRLIKRMEFFPQVIKALTLGLNEDEAYWQPEGGGWSIIEIVSHLIDEETMDFRTRLGATLTDPDQAWDPIDPDTWAREGNYQERDLSAVVSLFANERAESVRWLRSDENADWSRTHEHPKMGTISAGDLLASWAAHDALHLRQIARRLYEIALHDMPGFSAEYAGSF